jgi:hypothetical protein
MSQLRRAAVLMALFVSPLLQAENSSPASREEWIALFNGRNLDGWTPKITHHEVGENFGNTFRVEDGLLKVRYDQYKSFDDQFGHLFYKQPFSYYRLVVEYRFVGDQVAGGQRWALRNSGAMLHSPDPRTMLRDQDFPISIEAQMLGGLGDGKPRPTLNVCTPGTEIVYRGAQYPEHCLESASKTYDGDQWVRAEITVLGSDKIIHSVNGEKVLEYSQPKFGGGSVSHFDPVTKPDGKLIDSGFISLQSESHPIDFRKVELLNLAGCMDAKAANYKSYFVKSVPESCVFKGSGKTRGR